MNLKRALLVILVAAACGEARKVEEASPRDCPTWREDVQTLVQPCVTCHEELAEYAGALTMRATIAEKVNPATADATHQAFTSRYADLRRWSDECQLAFTTTNIHGLGIMDPQSDTFHGADVVRLGNSLELCANCHGSDFKGGSSGVSCTTCHTEEGGPTACTTCHGTPPASGAHVAHAMSPRLDRPVACTECHTVPEVYTAVGHVTLANGQPDPSPAEINFGALANEGTGPDRRGPAAIANQTCSNVYCHGDTLGNTGASHAQPSWNGGVTHGDCGACHGAPPTTGGHPNDPECSRCHVDHKNQKTPAHLDGAVQLGVDDSCDGCHGTSPTSPNPLSGAHRSHVEGTHRLAAPIACSTCHTVPGTLFAAGHIDSAAPAELIGEAAAAWSTADRTCSGSNCHGTDRTVAWNARFVTSCGTCHGIPPASDPHTTTMQLSDCATCHSATVDMFGNIKVVDGVSTHVNGVKDVVLR
jgi:predicted CxxxxCH...CXXCH cytochrome family protein